MPDGAYIWAHGAGSSATNRFAHTVGSTDNRGGDTLRHMTGHTTAAPNGAVFTSPDDAEEATPT